MIKKNIYPTTDNFKMFIYSLYSRGWGIGILIKIKVKLFIHLKKKMYFSLNMHAVPLVKNIYVYISTMLVNLYVC